jgi:cerevisin
MDSISGLNYVATQAASTGRPSIATLSLGGSANTALDNAITSLTSKGIHVTVAAGNDGTNAANTSPARVPSAITVGASTIADAKASFSNYGSVVDIFAPGQYVTSSWIGSTTATNNISGTSMATPHIAGLVAYLISVNGNASPASISSQIQSLSTKSALSGIRT